jgi:hypothetical protein
MAKGQHLSHHQHGIVKRYYANLDTLSLQKLGEIVSDLYLCTDARKAAPMWKRAEQALAKAGADPARVGKLLADRNVEGLAKLVGELSGPGGAPGPGARR